MISAERYETAWSQEVEYGSGRVVGIRIEIAGPAISEAIKQAARKATEELELLIEFEHYKNDPEVVTRKDLQRQELLALFQGRDIYVEEIENGYSINDPWYSQFPWFKVTTNKGIITLGWRKRVISIDWDGPTMKSCKELFPNEEVYPGCSVTKCDGPNDHSGSIHAWSLEKAQEYITRILT